MTEHIPTQDDKLAYAAGVCDAEGSFSINCQMAASVDVYNNNPKILEAIQSIVGFGHLTMDHRKSWHLRMGSHESVTMTCKNLLPFAVLKNRQMELLIEACGVKRPKRTEFKTTLSDLNAKMKQVDPPDKTTASKVTLPEDTRAWAYFAGFLDGDGTLVMQCQKHHGGRLRYYYPQMHIYSAKLAPLKYIRDLFGGMIDYRKRTKERANVLELSFEDQYYIQPILKGLRPYIVEKADQFDNILEACKKKTTEREAEYLKSKEINGKFRGLHKFTKHDDGTYTDGKRSPDKKHKTHRGVDIWTKTEIDTSGSVEEENVREDDGCDL